MVKKKKVLVLFGGRSGEHEVSLMSARSLVSALDPERYELILVGITHSGAWVTQETGVGLLDALSAGDLNGFTPVVLLPSPNDGRLFAIRNTAAGERLEPLAQVDVVFPALHGTFGEDGSLQGLLELADLPYVGAGVLGSAVGMDKAVFKEVMKAQNIPVAESTLVLRSEIESDLARVLEQVEKVSAYPLFVKPANLGSSVGVTKCHGRSDLVEGLIEAARFDRRVLVERGIDAREIEVSVLGNDYPRASIPGEIMPSREFYSYESKYLDGTSGLAIPADIPAETSSLVQSLALKAYQAIDCAGMARVDFLLDKHDGRVYLNEVNTIPGFTQISMYPKLWEASGLPYPRLIDQLIAFAFERKADRDQTERRFLRE
jgi:D-alanine-D-alanine ligase